MSRSPEDYESPADFPPDPLKQGPTRPGGTIALQGCLFGSVALFVVMLLLLLVLAYRRFREHTADPAPIESPTPALMIDG